MSKFSGKCDLFDHMSGLGGYYDKDGNSVKFNQDGVSCFYSDELKDFEAFKKLTNGILHQHYKVKVNEYNQKFVKEHCKEFDFIEHTKETEDKRVKTGKRIEKYYTYKYYNYEYASLKELNQKGVYIETDIHFNTLLDLIPYYPYLISMSCGSYVVITNESFVDSEFKDHLNYGWISELDYKKELQQHYLDVCKNYFLYKLEERTHVEPIIKNKLIPVIHSNIDTKNISCEHCDYVMEVANDIDYMHDIEFVWADGKIHSHWTSPKLIESNKILLSVIDVNQCLAEDIENGNLSIKYVATCDFPKEIN